jgi:hypothetical protein
MPKIVPEPIFDHSQLIMYSVRSWWPGFVALSLLILALRGASFGVEAHLSDPGQRAGDSPAGGAGFQKVTSVTQLND